jgi:hypothetical protein
MIQTCSDQSWNKTELAVGNHLIHVPNSCSVHYGDKMLPGESRQENPRINNTVEINYNINSILEEKSRLITEKFENKTDAEFDSWAEGVLHKAIIEKDELAAIIEENKGEIDAMLTLIEKNEENSIAWRDTDSQNDLNLTLTLVASIAGSIAISMFFMFCILRLTKCGRTTDTKSTRV